jgi:hypothetical protein
VSATASIAWTDATWPVVAGCPQGPPPPTTPQAPPAVPAFRLILVPLFRSRGVYRFVPGYRSKPVAEVAFNLSFSVTNEGPNAFPGGTISNLEFEAAPPQGHAFAHPVKLPAIGSGKSTRVPVSDFTLPFLGPVSIVCDVETPAATVLVFSQSGEPDADANAHWRKNVYFRRRIAWWSVLFGLANAAGLLYERLLLPSTIECRS